MDRCLLTDENLFLDQNDTKYYMIIKIEELLNDGMDNKVILEFIESFFDDCEYIGVQQFVENEIKHIKIKGMKK